MNSDNVFLKSNNLFPNTIQCHAGPCVFVIPRFPSYVPSEVLTDGHIVLLLQQLLPSPKVVQYY